MKHYLVIVVWFYLKNLTERDGGWAGKLQVWNVGIIYISWGVKQGKEKSQCWKTLEE